MRTVWRVKAQRQSKSSVVSLPVGAKLCGSAPSPGGAVSLFFDVDTEQEKAKFDVYVFQTGEEVPKDAEHIVSQNTFGRGLHVFKVPEPIDNSNVTPLFGGD